VAGCSGEYSTACVDAERVSMVWSESPGRYIVGVIDCNYHDFFIKL
jgi:hypothetical protein